MSHKYNAKPTDLDGLHFDSKAEAQRYRDLVLCQRAGAITNLEVHPRFVLQRAFHDNQGEHQRAITYEADFSYFEQGNPRLIVEDVKGFENQAWKIKRKLFLFHYPEYELRVVKA